MKPTFGRIFLLSGLSLAIAFGIGYGKGWGNNDWFTGIRALFGGPWQVMAAIIGFVLCGVLMKLEQRVNTRTKTGRTVARVIGWLQILAGLLAAVLVAIWGAGWLDALAILIIAFLLASGITPRAERANRGERGPGRIKKAWAELFPKEESRPDNEDDDPGHARPIPVRPHS